MELKCPKCERKEVRTTKDERYCRICGYRTKNKEEFEVKE